VLKVVEWSWPWCVPDGRGRGAKADVPGNPVVDRSAAGAVGTIDGTQVEQIDGHFGTQDIDVLNGYPFFQAKVAPGTHTIQIVNTGTRDSAATDTFVQIDMFAAFQ
jgi:hypothetical protein